MTVPRPIKVLAATIALIVLIGIIATTDPVPGIGAPATGGKVTVCHRASPAPDYASAAAERIRQTLKGTNR